MELNKNTINLINLLKERKRKNIPNISKNIFFMNLYNNIKNILKTNLVTEIKIVELENKPENYLEDNNFTSANIKNKILTKLKYSYDISNKNNRIIYFTSKKISKIPLIIKHMMIIINMLKILFNRTDSQKVIYFETLEKKKFPKKDNLAFGPNEVNSGLTFLDLHKNGEIILYRKEELLKVLIHELIHSNLIDEKIIFSKKIKDFSNIFCVNYRILLNEAFTESFATIINLFYIHIQIKGNKKDLNSMFQNEMKYSDYISSKIMNYYNIDKISNIIKNNDNCTSFFPQKTNVFAYYILKNILLSKHLLFGNIINKYNDNYKINDEKCINEIIKLIVEYIYILDDNQILNDKNNSLRLCLYELML